MTKNKAETVVRELFTLAGITINGVQPYDIEVLAAKSTSSFSPVLFPA
jgi:hypothetical protein